MSNSALTSPPASVTKRFFEVSPLFVGQRKTMSRSEQPKTSSGNKSAKGTRRKRPSPENGQQTTVASFFRPPQRHTRTDQTRNETKHEIENCSLNSVQVNLFAHDVD